MSGQFHAPGKEVPGTPFTEAQWAPEPVCLCRESSPGHPARRSVTILTEIDLQKVQQTVEYSLSTSALQGRKG
jgi:hypothetical protein